MVKLRMICPFHVEETPSLVIDYDTQEAYCDKCKKTYTFQQLDNKYMEVLTDDTDTHLRTACITEPS